MKNTSPGNSNGELAVFWNFAAAAGFFDVVTYEGDGLDGREEPHSLGSKPGFFIVKNTSSVADWACYHQETGASAFTRLNSDQPTSTGNEIWNHTEPTDKVFTVQGGSNNVRVNQSGESYVAYLFADNPDGGIKCGGETLSGGSATVTTGFRTGWLLVKVSNGTGNWFILDKERNTLQDILEPNTSAAEKNNAIPITITDTGFTINFGADQEFIYVAIADTTVRFYDENTASTVTNHTLTKRYGVDPDHRPAAVRHLPADRTAHLLGGHLRWKVSSTTPSATTPAN